jgi:ribosomal protein S18 acetylase RimI-like enzyme
MPVRIRLLGPGDAPVLNRVAADVFDHPLNAQWTAEFSADQRHHLVVALDESVVVGIASAVHYVHPDKARQLWINEVAVAPTHQGQGLGRQLIERMTRLSRELKCTEVWVLTDRSNPRAQRLYESAGATMPPDDCLMYTIRTDENAGES